MFVNCFHVFSLSALPCRKPENAQVPPSFPVVGLVFYLPHPKPPVLPDVRNRAINGSADLDLRRKNCEQDEKTSAFAPVQACGYGSTGADPAEVPLYISFLSHYSSKAPGNLFQGFRGPCCCHDHLRRGWICTSGIATLS